MPIASTSSVDPYQELPEVSKAKVHFFTDLFHLY